MKIQPNHRPDAVQPNPAGRTTPAPGSAAPAPSHADVADLSTTGRLVSELRAEASSHGGVRADVVAQMKAEISAGRLGTHEDIERAIDRLLGEL